MGAASVQAGKVGRWASEKDPLAVFQERIDEGTEKIAKGRQFLGQAGGEVRSAKRAVVELLTEEVRLNSRIDTAEKAGDPNHTLEGYALELADVEEKLGHSPDGWELDKEVKFVKGAGAADNPQDTGAGAAGPVVPGTVPIRQLQRPSPGRPGAGGAGPQGIP